MLNRCRASVLPAHRQLLLLFLHRVRFRYCPWPPMLTFGHSPQSMWRQACSCCMPILPQDHMGSSAARAACCFSHTANVCGSAYPNTCELGLLTETMQSFWWVLSVPTHAHLLVPTPVKHVPACSLPYA